MEHWRRVKWSEANQVAAAMGMAPELRPPSGLKPQDHYAALVERGELEQAVAFLGHALPRYEALAWAARLIERRSRQARLPLADQQVLDRVLRWVDDPSDAFRRDAFDAAERASDTGAERMLGIGVFFSGGSTSAPDLPPVAPPPELAGRFAGAAIVIAAHRSGDPAGLFREALASGERIAARGLEAGGQ